MKAISVLVCALVMIVAGCSKPEEEGTMEKAGKQVDEAIKSAESYTSDKLKEAGEAMQKAGEDMESKK